MKIIYLLNKIANGEEVPKKIKYKNNILYYDDDYTKEYPPTFNYYDEKGNNSLIEGWLCQYINDEVEIIEEDKKIETINNFTSNVGAVDENNIEEYIHKLFEQEFILFSKLDEIIDTVNEILKENPS